VLLESIGRFEGDAESAVWRVPASGAIVEKDVLNWGWVQSLLEVLDKTYPRRK
jgi:hypothetical protein